MAMRKYLVQGVFLAEVAEPINLAQHLSSVKKIEDGLAEMGVNGAEGVDPETKKWAPHEERRIGCEQPVGTVNVAQAGGTNDPGEYGVMEADDYYEGLRDRGLPGCKRPTPLDYKKGGA